MKEIVYLFIGMALGAILALLYAPESGKELRANIRSTGEADLQKLQSDWQASVQELNQRLAQLQTDLQQSSSPDSPGSPESETSEDPS
jgi:gas vesicle protein